jgi:hypothetical protein
VTRPSQRTCLWRRARLSSRPGRHPHSCWRGYRRWRAAWLPVSASGSRLSTSRACGRCCFPHSPRLERRRPVTKPPPPDRARSDSAGAADADHVFDHHTPTLARRRNRGAIARLAPERVRSLSDLCSWIDGATLGLLGSDHVSVRWLGIVMVCRSFVARQAIRLRLVRDQGRL